MFLDLFQHLYFHLTQTNVSFLTQWLHHFRSTPFPDIFNQRSAEEILLNSFLFLLISQLSSLFLSIINETLIHHSSMIVMRYHSSVHTGLCLVAILNSFESRKMFSLMFICDLIHDFSFIHFINHCLHLV